MASNHKYIVYKEELKLLSISKAYIMEMEDITHQREEIISGSYDILTKNFTKSVNKFIVFRDKENGQNIEIEHGIGQRSIFIDMLISHFENREEYEKCKKLLTLRELVVMAGD